METRGRKNGADYAKDSPLLLCRILSDEDMREIMKSLGVKSKRGAVYLVLEKYLEEINKKNEQAK